MTPLDNRKHFHNKDLYAPKARVRTYEASSATAENIRQITPIVQNKPKVKSPRIELNAFTTSTYAQMDNWLNAKNKPNSNPIQSQFKTNAQNGHKSLFYCTLYKKTAPRLAKKTNPIQTQCPK
jgi:hypothetical protein